MEIVQYTPDMQAPVTQFYNRLTADVPHCYPVKAEEFATAMRGVTTGKADKVEDEFQGQGLGRYLLQYALQEMKKIGYRHAAISTAWDNHRAFLFRAFLFYSNCGYRTVDWTYEFVKNLSETPTTNGSP